MIYSQTIKIIKFFPKYWTFGTSGIDSFGCNWSNENCWIVSSPTMICKVLKHLDICKCYGFDFSSMEICFILASYLGKSTWSITSFIKECIEYQSPQNFFVSGSDQMSIFAHTKINGNVIVAKVDLDRMTEYKNEVIHNLITFFFSHQSFREAWSDIKQLTQWGYFYVCNDGILQVIKKSVSNITSKK